MKIPKSLERLAQEIDGWLDLGCPERALEGMGLLLKTPGARPLGLMFQVRAFVDLGRFTDALRVLVELKTFDVDPEWLAVQEAWCRKRTDDMPGAIRCMERLIREDPRSAIGHYNLGCYLALTGERERALDAVTLACGIDDDFRKHAVSESDLDTLREDPRFDSLLPPDQRRGFMNS